MDGEHQSATAGDWGPVYGELLTFDDPLTRLPAIDRLEGFHPGGSSAYRRVLVATRIYESVIFAWVYTNSSPRRSWRHSPDGVWPGERC